MQFQYVYKEPLGESEDFPALATWRSSVLRQINDYFPTRTHFLVPFFIFLGSWVYAIIHWGWTLGLGLGLLPSLAFAFLTWLFVELFVFAVVFFIFPTLMVYFIYLLFTS